jgi:hypothetical protein
MDLVGPTGERIKAILAQRRNAAGRACWRAAARCTSPAS